MKKIILLFASLLPGVFSFAQLQNGNFENWSSVSSQTPNGWYNSNPDAYKAGLPFNVWQYTPAHGGNYAIEIKTEISPTDTSYGYLSNSPDPFNAKGGMPYSMQPDSFFCYAKLGIIPQDTALLLIIFKSGGTPISMNMYKITGNDTTVWQKLGFKLSTLPVAPDTMIIATACSNILTNQGMQNGSTIIFDDMYFKTVQPIPNGDFENWTNVNVESADNWKNANMQWVLLGCKPPLVKTTDAYEGTYAMKMTTQFDPGTGWFSGINNGFWNPAILDYTGGFAYSEQIDTLIGWYKYIPKSTGYAQVNINFQIADTTFATSGLQLNAAGSYTMFELPFNLLVVPDTAIITLNSSGWPVTLADTGSVFFVDGLQFKSTITTGINNFSSKGNMLISPNPTSGQFKILYPSKYAASARYCIIDLAGNIVKSDGLSGTLTSVDISGNPKGIYFIKVEEGSKVVSRKLILQ